MPSPLVPRFVASGPARPPQALASEKFAKRIDPPRTSVPRARRHQRAKKLQLGAAKKLQSE
jgi:hypothetical protein